MQNNIYLTKSNINRLKITWFELKIDMHYIRNHLFQKLKNKSFEV